MGSHPLLVFWSLADRIILSRSSTSQDLAAERPRIFGDLNAIIELLRGETRAARPDGIASSDGSEPFGIVLSETAGERATSLNSREPRIDG